MSKTFRPYRLMSWGGLKRYFVEWRRSALLRRELRILSDRERWDMGLRPMSDNDVRKSLWYLT
jgi:hypothetical protein